jgi:cysteine desulfurase
MMANNETGTIQPIEEIVVVIAEARSRGLDNLYIHTDAVQAAGKHPIDVKKLALICFRYQVTSFMGPKA